MLSTFGDYEGLGQGFGFGAFSAGIPRGQPTLAVCAQLRLDSLSPGFEFMNEKEDRVHLPSLALLYFFCNSALLNQCNMCDQRSHPVAWRNIYTRSDQPKRFEFISYLLMITS